MASCGCKKVNSKQCCCKGDIEKCCEIYRFILSNVSYSSGDPKDIPYTGLIPLDSGLGGRVFWIYFYRPDSWVSFDGVNFNQAESNVLALDIPCKIRLNKISIGGYISDDNFQTLNSGDLIFEVFKGSCLKQEWTSVQQFPVSVVGGPPLVHIPTNIFNFGENKIIGKFDRVLLTVRYRVGEDKEQPIKYNLSTFLYFTVLEDKCNKSGKERCRKCCFQCHV